MSSSSSSKLSLISANALFNVLDYLKLKEGILLSLRLKVGKVFKSGLSIFLRRGGSAP